MSDNLSNMLDSEDCFDFPTPDSPEFVLDNTEFDVFDLERDALYESPQRKKRVRKEGEAKSRKRKPAQKKNVVRTDDCDQSSLRRKPDKETPPRVERIDGAQYFDSDPWGFENVSVEPEVTALSQPSGRQENYLEFLDSVSADEDMFIRISREVFVVLGWTTEATVSLLDRLDYACTDIDGIPVNILSSVKNSSWGPDKSGVPVPDSSKERRLFPQAIHVGVWRQDMGDG